MTSNLRLFLYCAIDTFILWLDDWPYFTVPVYTDVAIAGSSVRPQL